MKAPTSNTIRLMVRLPADLHRKLQAQAAANERSLNGEIVYALKRYAEMATAAAGAAAEMTEDEALQGEAIAEADRGAGVVVSDADLAAIRREIAALIERGVTGGISPTLERLRREAEAAPVGH